MWMFGCPSHISQRVCDHGHFPHTLRGGPRAKCLFLVCESKYDHHVANDKPTSGLEVVIKVPCVAGNLVFVHPAKLTLEWIMESKLNRELDHKTCGGWPSKLWLIHINTYRIASLLANNWIMFPVKSLAKNSTSDDDPVRWRLRISRIFQETSSGDFGIHIKDGPLFRCHTRSYGCRGPLGASNAYGSIGVSKTAMAKWHPLFCCLCVSISLSLYIYI